MNAVGQYQCGSGESSLLLQLLRANQNQHNLLINTLISNQQKVLSSLLEQQSPNVSNSTIQSQLALLSSNNGKVGFFLLKNK
jgi:hypothetical protein